MEQVLEIPINTAEFEAVRSGETRSIVKLNSNHLAKKLLDKKGKDIEFEEITAVCRAGTIPCKPRIYRTSKKINGEHRPVVVFRAMNHAGV